MAFPWLPGAWDRLAPIPPGCPCAPPPGPMIGGLEIVAGGCAVFMAKRRYIGSSAAQYCHKTQGDLEPAAAVPTAQHVRERLLELAELDRRRREKRRRRDGEGRDPDSEAEQQVDEEEIFGSGVWGVDFMSLKYRDERILSVALYEETIKPRAVFPIIHPYILVETETWMYVLEKWRDGVAISRFKHKDDAVRSRGKWFGPGRLSQRKAPHLVQSTTTVSLTTTELLSWAMEHPEFKQYTDNCHTFAHNCTKKVGMQNPNAFWEDYLYDEY